jgi:HPt (histidine-containing phosphotransfer) domain-containing protein
LFADLKIAYKKYDVEAVRTISHTLKSSSINVGALKLSDLCRNVELSCQRGGLQESEIESLYRSYSETEDELTCLVDAMSKSKGATF